jgi:hypothetical protein
VSSLSSPSIVNVVIDSSACDTINQRTYVSMLANPDRHCRQSK